ncbi:hypothetical protein LOTGIDRAFT_152136 [Lottia gigantea]|uniref:palmitoyl-protein hydrolase n=1 Tax=Lottia gigantea TaxID=225164 RepID=V4BCA4_LOTGI|nr:hypothetical protein LOTGIDRAFT_152136 [Lottia gigantea]ESP05306.1 hypothetical protein LOTGIDRAFT_152136 [Lottia gigantea]
MPPPVIIQPKGPHKASLIFLHGLGDTGNGWSDVLASLDLKNLKIICPTAPIRPVSLNAGMPMPAWFDIKGLSPDSPEDEDGIKQASAKLLAMVTEEEKSGIPSERIAVGGFSQGGAVALHTAYSTNRPLGALLIFSAWMPLYKKMVAANEQNNKNTPILQCHGTNDPVVPVKWGQMTSQYIASFSTKHQFKTYPMMHSSHPQELADARSFLQESILKDI